MLSCVARVACSQPPRSSSANMFFDDGMGGSRSQERQRYLNSTYLNSYLLAFVNATRQ